MKYESDDNEIKDKHTVKGVNKSASNDVMHEAYEERKGEGTGGKG